MSWALPSCLALLSLMGILVPSLRAVGFDLLTATGGFVSWALAARYAPASFSLRYISLMGVFFATYTAMIVIPSLYVRLLMPEIGGPWFYLGVVGVLPLSVIGWFLVHYGLGQRRDQFEQYFQAPIQIEPGRLPIVCFVGLVALCLGLALLHVLSAPVNPLKLLLSGASSSELVAAREASLKTLPGSGIKYLVSWMMSVLFPLAALWSLGRAVLERTLVWKVVAALVILLALTYATFTTAKAPAAMLVCMLMIVVFVLRREPVPLRLMILGGVVVLAIPAVLVASISDVGPLAVLAAIARRLLYVPAEALVFYFETFDAEHPFLDGRSINLVSRRVFQEAPFPISNFVYHQIHEGGIKTGLSNAAFIGTMWANFAHVGLLIGPLFVGALIALSEFVVTSGSRTMLKVCLHAMVCLQVFFLSSRSVTVAMLTGGWVPALGLVVLATLLFRWTQREWPS